MLLGLFLLSNYFTLPKTPLLKTIIFPYWNDSTPRKILTLKENCNGKTSWLHPKVRSKSCKMRPKSLQSAKPFSRYSNLKIEIWTILREKTTEKPKMLFFYMFCKNWITIDCMTSEMINARINNNQFRISNISVCRANTSMKFYEWIVWHIWNTTVIFLLLPW